MELCSNMISRCLELPANEKPNIKIETNSGYACKWIIRLLIHISSKFTVFMFKLVVRINNLLSICSLFMYPNHNLIATGFAWFQLVCFKTVIHSVQFFSFEDMMWHSISSYSNGTFRYWLWCWIPAEKCKCEWAWNCRQPSYADVWLYSNFVYTAAAPTTTIVTFLTSLSFQSLL